MNYFDHTVTQERNCPYQYYDDIQVLDSGTIQDKEVKLVIRSSGFSDQVHFLEIYRLNDNFKTCSDENKNLSPIASTPFNYLTPHIEELRLKFPDTPRDQLQKLQKNLYIKSLRIESNDILLETTTNPNQGKTPEQIKVKDFNRS